MVVNTSREREAVYASWYRGQMLLKIRNEYLFCLASMIYIMVCKLAKECIMEEEETSSQT